MKSEIREYTIEEVVKGYKDSGEEGVAALGGRLDIRPAYQREFVYKDKQRDDVIETVFDGLPLNLMYWARTGVDTFEVLDGQQRTLSICKYVNGDFSYKGQFFFNLPEDIQRQVLDYRLLVCICQGSPSELLSWFERVNIAGEKLTPQELRNAVYTGPWLSDAKAKFSKSNGPAYLLSNDGGALLSGSPIRQEYLETALKWISNGSIEDYMAKHQHAENAEELWQYFQAVIVWVRKTFPYYRKPMQKVQWGVLFNVHGKEKLDAMLLEERIQKLMVDEDVQKKPGIYPYLFSGDERYLSIRTFTDNQKVETYERQAGVCAQCGEHFELHEMEADHITPWCKGGKTIPENCQMLCQSDNRRKSGK